VAFTVVTDREIRSGCVRLGQFRAIFPLNGRHDSAIVAYANHGGHVLKYAAQLADYAPAYITFTPANTRVEAIPTVNLATQTAWMTFSGWRPGHSYSGVASINLKALGLRQGQYHIVNAATGKLIPGAVRGHNLSAALHIMPGELAVWRLSPGAGK
jgi:hypothetical protein